MCILKVSQIVSQSCNFNIGLNQIVICNNQPDGITVRGCGKPATEDNTTSFSCPSNRCNGDIFPVDRLHCLHCAGADCVRAPNNVTYRYPCVNYTEADSCYSVFSHGKYWGATGNRAFRPNSRDIRFTYEIFNYCRRNKCLSRLHIRWRHTLWQTILCSERTTMPAVCQAWLQRQSTAYVGLSDMRQVQLVHRPQLRINGHTNRRNDMRAIRRRLHKLLFHTYWKWNGGARMCARTQTFDWRLQFMAFDDMWRMSR